MPDEWRLTQFLRRLTEAAEPPWTDRQILLFLLAVISVTGTEAVFIPAKRGALPAVAFVAISAFLVLRSRRRQEPPPPAALLAAVARDDVPADVIALVAVGKKIEAIKLYRRLTGASLREAKDFIDSL
jgi:hypothetical protein